MPAFNGFMLIGHKNVLFGIVLNKKVKQPQLLSCGDWWQKARSVFLTVL